VGRKKGHGGHHGGSWKVALADFMTSMFALFLVLWLVASADADKRTLIAGWFRDPSIFKEGSILPVDLGGAVKPRTEPVTPEKPTIAKPRPIPAKEVSEGQRQMAKALQEQPGLQGLGERVQIKPTDEGLEVALHDAAGESFFASGSSDLTDQGREVVAQVAVAISQGDDDVVIAGHTDSVPFAAGGKDNWELSADRANAVRAALADAGVAAERVGGVVGYADSRPARPDDAKAPENRRVTILLRPRPPAPPDPDRPRIDDVLAPSQR
jgi:chemotaxis protein MotB